MFVCIHPPRPHPLPLDTMESPTERQPSKRFKHNTPQSEAKCLFIEDEDEQVFKKECKAASSPLFLSPLGNKLVIAAEAKGEPIDLLEINKKVIEHDVQEMIDEDNKVLDLDSSKTTTQESDAKPTAAGQTITAQKKKKDKKTEKKGDVKTEIEATPFIPHNADEICDECGLSPCEAETYKVLLQKAGDEMSKKNNHHNRATRHHLYKLYTATKYGKLGRSHRVRIPECVEESIHDMFPDPNNEYTGFRHSIGELQGDDYDRLMVDEQPANYSDSSDDE